MGLFIGFSFISLVEIFYYAVIKPFPSFRKQQKGERKPPTKVVKCLTCFLFALCFITLVSEEN